MNKLICCLLFSLILVTAGCKSDKLSEKTSPKEDKTTKTKGERAGTYQIYFVTVDNLRVREAALKSSKVIDKLKEGTLVYSNGTASNFVEKITLRNKVHESPYRQITYNGNSGWIYGGGLYKIYDEGEADSFTETLESLVTQLNNKSKPLLDRGKYILRVLQQENSGSAEWNDIMYLIAEHQLKNIATDKEIYPILEGREWTNEDYTFAAQRNYDMQSNDFAKNFSAAGLKFTASEGMVTAILDPAKIKSAIGGPFSLAFDEYIVIQQESANNRFYSDASISSPLNDIVDYTVLIEKFIAHHPYFPRTPELKQELIYLHSSIIHGTSNSPSHSFETQLLNPEWPIAWNHYLRSIENGIITDKLRSELAKSNNNK